MSDPEIDPQRVAEIVEEFRELAKELDKSEAAKIVGAEYGMTAQEILHLSNSS